MVDVVCSLALIAIVLLTAIAYGLRIALRGHATSARVEKEGESRLLGKSAMEGFHWVLAPVGAASERIGLSANGVTFGSLALAVGAGVAITMEHPGVGAALAATSATGDGLDGILARRLNTASEAGEVIDSAVDRYSELAVLGGIAIAFRFSALLLLLTLLAILASFMVSYSTAKAQALQLPAPRGSMRRSERAVYLILGTALAPLTALVHPSDPAWGRAPVVAALTLVAVVGNVSAVRRLAAIARGARARMAERRAAP